jgi:hypothetical protein
MKPGEDCEKIERSDHYRTAGLRRHCRRRTSPTGWMVVRWFMREKRPNCVICIVNKM